MYANEWQTRNTVRQKIESLLAAYQEKKFKEWLDTGQIKCQPAYRLPERITVKVKSIGLAKGLYTEEESINGSEYDVINAVANLDNVLFGTEIRAARDSVLTGISIIIPILSFSWRAALPFFLKRKATTEITRIVGQRLS